MSIYDSFPNIGDYAAKVTSAPTPTYNCIAWAFGDDRRFWWPGARTYWPLRPHSSNALEAFHALFDAWGWQRTESRAYEGGQTKIALYWNNGSPTHAARLLASGKWTSKLGNEHDIMHEIEDLYGPLYGMLYGIFARPDQL